MSDEMHTPDECLIHNLSGCASLCGIGCAPEPCNCECCHPDCPVPWLDMKEFAR